MSEKGDLMNRTARLLAILLAVVVVGGGLYVAYSAGFDNGALAATATGDNGGTGTVQVPGQHWGRPYGWHGGFGFFPFFLFFPILFLFLIFAAFRPRHWGGGYGPGWGGPSGWGSSRQHIEERLTDWHKQAHGEPTEKES
jgi:hypothetical protein